MSVMYGKGPKGKATKLHAQLVRSRGRCERCGSSGPLECAHIISRRFSAVRTDERNAWCLCSSCHRRLGLHADEHMQLVAVTIGMDLFHELKQKALDNLRPWKDHEWQAEVERLQQRLGEVAA